MAKTNGAEQGPESRLYSAGFTRRLEFWCPPGEDRALGMDDATAMLDAGEVKPHPPEVLDWSARSQPGFAELTAARVDELADQIFRPPPPSEPPPLPSWAEPWAELVAAKLTLIIRREIRAAMKAEARKQAREPKT